jgi:hypothetical protein
MVRLVTMPLLFLVVGTTAVFAQIGPLTAPGPAASPYTPAPPAFAPGPAAPGISSGSPIAPGPAVPLSSYDNPSAPAEARSDRVSRCTQYGVSTGVQPNDVGAYVSQCAQQN